MVCVYEKPLSFRATCTLLIESLCAGVGTPIAWRLGGMEFLRKSSVCRFCQALLRQNSSPPRPQARCSHPYESAWLTGSKQTEPAPGTRTRAMNNHSSTVPGWSTVGARQTSGRDKAQEVDEGFFFGSARLYTAYRGLTAHPTKSTSRSTPTRNKAPIAGWGVASRPRRGQRTADPSQEDSEQTQSKHQESTYTRMWTTRLKVKRGRHRRTLLDAQKDTRFTGSGGSIGLCSPVVYCPGGSNSETPTVDG